MNVFLTRLEKAKQLLGETQIDALVVTSSPNVYYFSGTWLDSHERLQAIVISRTEQPKMIVHEMSEQEVSPPSQVDTIFWKDGEPAIEILAQHLPHTGTIAIDNQWPSGNLIELMGLKRDVSFVKSTQLIGQLRLRKDEVEIELLRKSGQVADEVMSEVIQFIRPGLKETEVVEQIKSLFKAKGVDKLSFNPILATGKNGAIPHHQSDDTVIQRGDMVVIDMGGIKDYYCSDITRTICVGEPAAEMRTVYRIVQQAQEEAVQAIKPGIPMQEIDRIAREIITKAGYGPYFTHRTGHGLGIEVHEEPFLTANNDQLLEEGMVVSVEPGIYLTDQFGVRIEDIVVVTETGVERLNHYPRELLCVDTN
ncbi:Xaa-Pro dipeptidase [Caldalkalibacillus uzonensis]|uniref:Xaa-Pro dipeptidase n=1 Tax=Caldalkalibacillus uzonensis TaxID=353224 RepID=A0ABU0CS91_9BACI|nr:Xaa-Pro peptidase family protein [Caldalkalibacillus uzonensis]MDQ0338746.1 Xaa-Pro dipeptidase [Caldalkalibacillus uzonensis]